MGEAKRRLLAGTTFKPNLQRIPKDFRIENPLVIMFFNDQDKVTTHIHPAPGYTHQHYGLIVCDLVRHVARAYGVDEDDVWEFVEKERDAPTTDIVNPS